MDFTFFYLAPMQLFSELEHCYLGAATLTDRKIEIYKVKVRSFVNQDDKIYM